MFSAASWLSPGPSARRTTPWPRSSRWPSTRPGGGAAWAGPSSDAVSPTDADPEAALVGTNFLTFPDGRFDAPRKVHWLKYGKAVRECYRAGGHCVSVGTAMFRGSVIDRIGPFNRKCPGAEDYEIVARALSAGHRVDNLPEPLYFNRLHAGKRSSLYYGRRRGRN